MNRAHLVNQGRPTLSLPTIAILPAGVQVGQSSTDSLVRGFTLFGAYYNFPQPLPTINEQLQSCFLTPHSATHKVTVDDRRKLEQFCGDMIEPSSMLSVSFVLQNCVWDEFPGKPLRDVLDETFPCRGRDNEIHFPLSNVYVSTNGGYATVPVTYSCDASRVVTRFDGTLATLWIRMLPGRVLQRRTPGGVTAALVRDLVVRADGYLLSYTDVETGKFDRVMVTNVHEFNFLFVAWI